jgi:hypothetical protein
MAVNISITVFHDSGYPEDTGNKPLHNPGTVYMASHPMRINLILK